MFKRDYFLIGLLYGAIISIGVSALVMLLNVIVIGKLYGKPILSDTTILVMGLLANLVFTTQIVPNYAQRITQGMTAFMFIAAGYIIWQYYGASMGIR